MESKICKWKILWCTTNTYKMGYSWILRSIYRRRFSIINVSNEMAIC